MKQRLFAAVLAAALVFTGLPNVGLVNVGAEEIETVKESQEVDQILYGDQNDMTFYTMSDKNETLCLVAEPVLPEIINEDELSYSWSGTYRDYETPSICNGTGVLGTEKTLTVQPKKGMEYQCYVRADGWSETCTFRIRTDTNLTAWAEDGTYEYECEK